MFQPSSPREAGCDDPVAGVGGPHATVSTLIPREAGCDLGASWGSSASGKRFNPHPARGGMRPHRAARLHSTTKTRFNPHPARGGMRPGRSCTPDPFPIRFNPHPAARRDATTGSNRPRVWSSLCSTLIPREAGCDAEARSRRSAGPSFNPHPARGGMRRSVSVTRT